MNTQLDLAALEKLGSLHKHGQIIAIASGKGGVGKTSATLNMAQAAAKQGKKVLVFDADLGLANVDVQLGVNPARDLSEVLTGNAELEQVITRAPKAGFDFIAGRSGSDTLPFTTALDRRNILKQIEKVAANYDLVLLDIAAGVGDDVLSFANFADKTLLVITPDPSSITDSYAVIKLLKAKHYKNNCQVLINQANGDIEARNTYEKIRMAADKFLQIDIPLFGVIPHDKNYIMAVRKQTLLLESFPHMPIADTIRGLAKKLIDQTSD